eukprot:TRINITY_DN67421_c5_g9_i1.p1 TRINITY_DN67421_c5_g9~~TRINITY_DN67421_c5_g9_i1.p1  ORF type:complete len:730 (+),score=349.28 TRINITY_DN67421_c5_g9_i1:35-2224(+)
MMLRVATRRQTLWRSLAASVTKPLAAPVAASVIKRVSVVPPSWSCFSTVGDAAAASVSVASAASRSRRRRGDGGAGDDGGEDSGEEGRKGGGRKGGGRRWLFVIATAAGGVAVSHVLPGDDTSEISLYERRVEPWMRFARSAVVGAITVADYEWTLRNLEPGTPEYYKVRETIHQRSAERLLWLCKKHGGIFTKAGQHIASLNHVLPRQYTETMSVLQDRALARSFEDVVRVIREETGMHPNELFAQMDEQPMASASLAQVHRGVTHDGEEVAIKVQYPGLYHMFTGDMWTMAVLTKFVERVYPDVRLNWIVRAFRNNVLRELNFVLEGNNAEHVAESFKDHKRLYIPKVRWDLTTQRLLTMEFIHGCKVNDKNAIKAMGLEPIQVARTLSNVFGKMIYCDGFVHSDPHPGNVLIRRHPNANGHQMVLLDHGLYRELDEDFRRNYCRMWNALFSRNQSELQEVCDKLGVERFWKFFPLILTFRSHNSQSKLGQRMSQAEVDELRRDLKEFGFADMTQFLESLPQDMLFVLRTNNLVRSINKDLGGTSTGRFFTMMHYAVRGLHTTNNLHAHTMQVSRVARQSAAATKPSIPQPVVHVRREEDRSLLASLRMYLDLLWFRCMFLVYESVFVWMVAPKETDDPDAAATATVGDPDGAKDDMETDTVRQIHGDRFHGGSSTARPRRDLQGRAPPPPVQQQLVQSATEQDTSGEWRFSAWRERFVAAKAEALS